MDKILWSTHDTKGVASFLVQNRLMRDNMRHCELLLVGYRLFICGLLPYVETQFSSLGWLGNVRQIAIQNGGSWSLFFIPAGFMRHL